MGHCSTLPAANGVGQEAIEDWVEEGDSASSYIESTLKKVKCLYGNAINYKKIR